jgi:CHAT domain-containing protein
MPITVFVAENNQLPPLLYQQEFVDKLRARYDVRVYSGAQSTKAALIKVIEKVALVVVVAHGVGNRSDDSAEKGIYLYDGFLSADEITELNSRTQLLVLAGCSTSIGFRTIEGNINLPRAFALAGVKSMLVSNWDIDERSSLLLIEQWLYYLHQGHSKPEALRLAKADFLRSATARLSAPLYWGAFSIIGDEGAVRIRGRWFMHYMAGGALTLMIGLFLLYRKRTTSS